MDSYKIQSIKAKLKYHIPENHPIKIEMNQNDSAVKQIGLEGSK